MLSVVFFLAALLMVTINAHFQLQFPSPRGPFNEDNEVTFCDGYLEPASNRTRFPLSGGLFKMDVEHQKWVAGVLVSTAQNATSFANFSQLNLTVFHSGQGAATFCIPLDFSKSNVTGLQAGQNVTIQIVFNGGDGPLYQCADLTLVNNLNISSTVSCSNATSSGKSSSGPIFIMVMLAVLPGMLLY